MPIQYEIHPNSVLSVVYKQQVSWGEALSRQKPKKKRDCAPCSALHSGLVSVPSQCCLYAFIVMWPIHAEAFSEVPERFFGPLENHKENIP